MVAKLVEGKQALLSRINKELALQTRDTRWASRTPEPFRSIFHWRAKVHFNKAQRASNTVEKLSREDGSLLKSF